MAHWAAGSIAPRDVELWGRLWCWTMPLVEPVVLFLHWKTRYRFRAYELSSQLIKLVFLILHATGIVRGEALRGVSGQDIN